MPCSTGRGLVVPRYHRRNTYSRRPDTNEYEQFPARIAYSQVGRQKNLTLPISLAEGFGDAKIIRQRCLSKKQARPVPKTRHTSVSLPCRALCGASAISWHGRARLVLSHCCTQTSSSLPGTKTCQQPGWTCIRYSCRYIGMTGDEQFWERV